MAERDVCIFCGAYATRDHDGEILAWAMNRGQMLAAGAHDHETIEGER